MQAIVVTGGKQYKVSEGDVIYVEKLPVEDGQEVNLENILAVFENEKVEFGNPTVAGASVTAKVIKNGKSKKIIVFKYKAKKGYRRRQGHRQAYTKLQIEKINIG